MPFKINRETEVCKKEWAEMLAGHEQKFAKELFPSRHSQVLCIFNVIIKAVFYHGSVRSWFLKDTQTGLVKVYRSWSKDFAYNIVCPSEQGRSKREQHEIYFIWLHLPIECIPSRAKNYHLWNGHKLDFLVGLFHHPQQKQIDQNWASL